MADDIGARPTDQALVASDGAASVSTLSGFDPSRDALAERLLDMVGADFAYRNPTLHPTDRYTDELKARGTKAAFCAALDEYLAIAIETQHAEDVKRNGELEGRIAAVTNVIEQGYKEPPNKERCDHGKFNWEVCVSCYDEALLAALQSPDGKDAK